jgi:hypothetical protein
MRFSFASLIPVYFDYSSAWNSDGHDAVGATSMSMIDSSASSRLKGILGGQDASEVATWAHKIEKSVEWTTKLHFVAQDDDWVCGVTSSTLRQSCPGGHCLISAIRHFYTQSTRGDINEPKNAMDDPSGFTDADAIRLLIGLMGDLAQPLHVGFKSNDFGRNVWIRTPDRPGSPSSIVSLYDLWDRTLIEQAINNPYNPSAWWSGWTHIRSLNPSVVQAEKIRWEEKGIDALDEWVKESAEFACNRIYTNPLTKERFNLAQGSDNPISVPQEVYNIWEREMKERILIGGVRLGLILNGILNSKDVPAASKLRRGSAVNDKSKDDIIEIFDDLDDRGENTGPSKSKRSPVVGSNAGFLNVGILFAVILIVLIAYKAGATSSTSGFPATKTQIVEMVGSSSKLSGSHRD